MSHIRLFHSNVGITFHDIFIADITPAKYQLAYRVPVLCAIDVISKCNFPKLKLLTICNKEKISEVIKKMKRKTFQNEMCLIHNKIKSRILRERQEKEENEYYDDIQQVPNYDSSPTTGSISNIDDLEIHSTDSSDAETKDENEIQERVAVKKLRHWAF